MSSVSGMIPALNNVQGTAPADSTLLCHRFYSSPWIFKVCTPKPTRKSLRKLCATLPAPKAPSHSGSQPLVPWPRSHQPQCRQDCGLQPAAAWSFCPCWPQNKKCKESMTPMWHSASKHSHLNAACLEMFSFNHLKGCVEFWAALGKGKWEWWLKKTTTTSEL